MAKEIAPKDLRARLNAGDDLMLIDVREDWEVKQAKLAEAIHIPMDEIPDSLDRIPKDKTIVFICKMGSRSEAVADWLESQGYTNILNLSGGMFRWAQEVDPSLRNRLS